MSSLPASLKRIGSIATEKKWWRRFFRRSRAANSIVSGGIWPKFKLIQASTHVLITCKYEKDPIKNSWENVMTQFSPLSVYGNIFRRSRAANSIVRSRFQKNFELMQALMYVIVTCKYKKDRIKNRKMWWRPFPHYNPMGVFVGMETRVLTSSASKPNATFPPPQ